MSEYSLSPDRKFRYMAILSLMSLLSFNALSAVTASVDKNPVMLDESVNLSIIADKDVDRSAFDPTPLLKDFVVGRTSVSSQTKMVNFDTTRTTIWSTTLIPRKKGNVIIPSFQVDGESTQPISLQVIPATDSNSSDKRDMFISTEVDVSEVYLQQQIHYKVKLHLALDLQRGSLSNPTLENADIRQIGKDKEYNEISNGRRYRIIERNFAITPQQSGKFTIQGPLFEGEVVDNNRQSFGFFNRTKPINRVGKAVEVNVLPIPEGYNYHWLPSEFVQINEEWQPTTGEFKVGEPITRTLTLTAVGLVEEQLPEIASQYPPQVKTYPDQANTATVERDNTLIAQRVESIAIIPNKAGDLVIPEVTVPWFNILTKQTEFAKLPARLISISPSSLPVQNSLPVTAKPDLANSTPLIPAEQGTELTPSIKVNSNAWWSISSWILLILWLGTLLMWRMFPGNNNTSSKKRLPPSSSSEQQYWQKLQKALASNDVQNIYIPLNQWLGQLLGDQKSALPTNQAKLSDPALDKEISAMFAAQYGQTSTKWRADTLSGELKRVRAAYNNAKQGHALKSLYPQAS